MKGYNIHNPIPETGFIRLPNVLKVIPVGKTTWWEGVKTGRFPKPIKLGKRITAWRVEDIKVLIEGLSTKQLPSSKNMKEGAACK